MKNGKEVGRIKFSIDSWWISDQDANIKKKEREESREESTALFMAANSFNEG
jgi:hypothetical protein